MLDTIFLDVLIAIAFQLLKDVEYELVNENGFAMSKSNALNSYWHANHQSNDRNRIQKLTGARTLSEYGRTPSFVSLREN